MKFDFKSALMGACLVFGIVGLNSFRTPTRDCLTQEQQDILALFSLTPGYIDNCNSGSYPTLRLSGVNLQIVNGLGSTSQTDGTGNLIVGYLNYHCGGGSHNVIIGDGHDVSGYSCLVGGHNNTASAEKTIVFGSGNTVSLPYACILGGSNNTNDSSKSVIVGGSDNHVYSDASYAVIVGGENNEITSGYDGVVGGGNTRSVSGTDDWTAGTLFEDN